MARLIRPFPGQRFTKTYSSQEAYQAEASKLALQGWSVKSLVRNDASRQLNRPYIVVTYDYQPATDTTTSLPSRPVMAPPSETWAPGSPSRSLYPYPIWEAILVACLLALGPVLIFAGGAGFGSVMFIAGLIYAAIRDGRGLLSLRDHIHWAMMPGINKVLLICGIVIFFPVFPAIYAARIVIDAFRSSRATAQSAQLELQRRTAALESQLGILPSVEGECRACHKPLQVGAEYCAYCGESVVLRPRICPVCAATALPDAKFYPTCRTVLPPSV